MIFILLLRQLRPKYLIWVFSNYNKKYIKQITEVMTDN